MPALQINFRADDDLTAKLSERAEAYARGRPTGLASVAGRDLERYYALLARELRAVALTEAEVKLVCDATNGTLWEPHTVPLLWAEVEDAIRHDGLDAKWAVDGAALVATLRALTLGQSFAVVDAVERFWREPQPLDERLRAVGLLGD